MSDVETALKPMVSYLKVDASGPHLEGQKCAKCGTIYVGERPTVAGVAVCGACGARGSLGPVRLANTGKLYNYTVVERTFPGIPVPFISAIVDLDGGGSLRGNLIDVEPKPEAIKFDMPVKVVYRDAGRQDKDGNSYLAFFFAPA
jgi:uncharacterized OB-fold protein